MEVGIDSDIEVQPLPGGPPLETTNYVLSITG